MAESPTPPDQRQRLLAFGALSAAFLVVLIMVVAALAGGGGSDAGGPGPSAPTARHGAAAASATTTATTTTATTAVAGPARDMGEPGPPRPVPILSYHIISDPLPDSPTPELYVPKAELEEQMQALKDAGYTAVTLQEWWDSWHAEAPLPAKPVVVSFDDGYHSHLANALPVLRALGWPGVLNLALENVRSDYGLTAPQVRELIDAGWEVDSRTIDHPDLTTDDATLEHEVADSRAELKRRFGVAVNFFCYPTGRYDDAAIAAVHAAGYLAATTTELGLAQPDEADRFTLPRVPVNPGVTGPALVEQLDGLS